MRDSPRIISEAQKRDALRGVLFASAAAAAGQGGGDRPARKNKKGTPLLGASLFGLKYELEGESHRVITEPG